MQRNEAAERMLVCLKKQAIFNNRVAGFIHGLFFTYLLVLSIDDTLGEESRSMMRLIFLLGSSFLGVLGSCVYDVHRDELVRTLQNSNALWACAKAVVEKPAEGLKKLDEIARAQFYEFLRPAA